MNRASRNMRFLSRQGSDTSNQRLALRARDAAARIRKAIPTPSRGQGTCPACSGKIRTGKMVVFWNSQVIHMHCAPKGAVDGRGVYQPRKRI